MSRLISQGSTFLCKFDESFFLKTQKEVKIIFFRCQLTSSRVIDPVSKLEHICVDGISRDIAITSFDQRRWLNSPQIIDLIDFYKMTTATVTGTDARSVSKPGAKVRRLDKSARAEASKKHFLFVWIDAQINFGRFSWAYEKCSLFPQPVTTPRQTEFFLHRTLKVTHPRHNCLSDDSSPREKWFSFLTKDNVYQNMDSEVSSVKGNEVKFSPIQNYFSKLQTKFYNSPSSAASSIFTVFRYKKCLLIIFIDSSK